MKLSTVGLGFVRTSKKGNKYIALTFAEDLLDNTVNTDFLKKMCIFKKVSKKGNDYYQVTCPVKDDYEPNIKLDFGEIRKND